MDKNLALGHLVKAIASHIKWVEDIKRIIDGEDVELVEVNATKCGFGTWFLDEGQKLSVIKTVPKDSMELINTLHNKVHDPYLNIHAIYFNVEKKSLVKRLMRKKKKIEPKEVETAKAHLKELEKISFDLLEELHRLERRTYAFPESDFQLL